MARQEFLTSPEHPTFGWPRAALRGLRHLKDVQVGSACVLGAGATAATALHTLGCTQMTALTRDTTRTGELADAAKRIGSPYTSGHGTRPPGI